MSGSCLNIARIQDANVIPAFALICDWLIPSSLISIGSSIVVILTCSSFKLFKTEYNVVVLPEPVGPEVKMIPFGIYWHHLLIVILIVMLDFPLLSLLQKLFAKIKLPDFTKKRS